MTEYSEEDVSNRLREVIEKGRQRAEEYEIVRRTPLFNYSSPCQLELFWMDSPLELQLLVKTNDKNRPDKEIIINGPSSGDDFIGLIDKNLKKPRWQQVINSDQIHPRRSHPISLERRRDVIIPEIRDFVNYTQESIFDSPPQNNLASKTVSPNICAYFIYGNIVEADHPSFYIIDFEAEEEEKEEGDAPTEAESDEEFDEPEFEIGAYTFEPVWIEGPPDWSFEEQVLDTSHSFDEICEIELGGYTLQIYRDGYLELSGDIDRDKATEIFNTIFSVGIFKGYEWEAIQDSELSQYMPSPHQQFEPQELRKELSSARSLLLHTRGYSQFEDRPIIEQDEMKEIISIATNLHEDDDLIDKAQFTLQAYTHYRNNEHSQAFLLNWILLEQYITQLLNDDLDAQMGLNHERRNRITDSPNWFASHRIELAEIIGSINNDQYSSIDKMRKRRNSIVHEMDTADEQLSEDIMKLIFDLIGTEMPFRAEPPL